MILCIWWNGSLGNWDSGLLSEIFGKHPDIFIQYNQKDIFYTDKAIVIIVGSPEIEPLRKYLETLKSGLVILTSEEEGTFDWKSAIPEHLEIWTQYYQPKTKSEIKERILLGVPNRFKDYKINTHLPKKYLWSYIGQNQHEQRNKCIEVLKTMKDGFLHITDGFGGQNEGVDGNYQRYLDVCAQSKFVICPAGNLSAESFRVYEGMEMGAIIIADERHYNDDIDFYYWDAVYKKHNIIPIYEWSKEVLEYIFELHKHTVPEQHNRWWFDYKTELENKLLDYAKH